MCSSGCDGHQPELDALPDLLLQVHRFIQEVLELLVTLLRFQLCLSPLHNRLTHTHTPVHIHNNQPPDRQVCNHPPAFIR